MNIIIYEDKPEHFEPLIDLYPQYFLRLGMMRIADNTATYFKKASIYYIARHQFKNNKFVAKDPALYISGRAMISEHVTIPDKDTKLFIGSQPIGFVKQSPPFPEDLKQIQTALRNIKHEKEIKGTVVDDLWDLIRLNPQLITRQFESIKAKSSNQKHIYIIGKKNHLYIDDRACVHEFVTIDLTNGPVYIAKNAIIRPFSIIIGPSYVGPETVIDRAKIKGSSIGPFCRIGGEVEECIFQGYANKQHEGFIGHSFIGEWVNLGALTTNSDLKNNYGDIHIIRGKKKINTGMRKLGCFIGDHVKTGIGTLIPTGAIIGTFTNFFGGGMMPKNVSRFSWLNAREKTKYDLEKAIVTARIVMQRRDVALSKQYEGLIRSLYKWQSSL